MPLLIIGLGNPGKEYHMTRHNVGFLAVDAYAQKLEVKSWKLEKRLQAEVAKSEDIILVKPQTFMNNSGVSVNAIRSTLKLQPSNFVVIHDDIDLPFDTIRVGYGSASAGHNGVASIIDHLGTKDFWRVRIGIKPECRSRKSEVGSWRAEGRIFDTANYVLKKFSAEEKKKLPKILNTVVELIEEFAAGNQKVQTVHC